MRNKTLKNRYGPKGVKVRKNNFIQSIQGEYEVEYNAPFQETWIHEIAKKKPKSFSLYHWLYPVLYNNYCNETEANAAYERYKNWLNQGTKTVKVYVSGRMQHLTMCFNSPHFTSCGMTSMFELCSEKIKDPDVFCIFTRDRSGKVETRRICETVKKLSCIKYYSAYGSRVYIPAIDKILQEIANKNSMVLVGDGHFF